ncbi:tyrosine-type recombinase/integrase [Streptomyces sp. NPDC005786]|uniref:tyrosine-type recombinase/integrase n=1 Tax=Streptomyces sp. NPDC005786 TaxID=3154891 RepID=UPI0033C231F1
MAWQPQLERRSDVAGNPAASLGHALVDDYLEFVAARCRPNTLLATAYDLKVFFSVVPKDPADVVTADIFAFITAQKKPRRGPKVVRLEDGEAGLSARTIKRRLASVSGLFGYLMTRDDLAIDRNPVPTGLATRRRSGNRGAPLLRTPRTLPRVLGPGEVERVLGAVNTARDRAMVLSMLLGGLRRCEVLGLKLGDLSPGERRVFISEGKGGHQRLIPVSAQFFAAVGDYLDRERPPVAHGRLFVVLRGPTRGRPLSADGLDEILDGVRKRTGLPKLTCPRPPQQTPWLLPPAG